MTEPSFSPLPPISTEDHVRGPAEGVLVIGYGDFECPFCAVLSLQLEGRPLRCAFRHFPVRANHARAWPAACAAEAAGLQGRFWEMHDSLFADQGRLEDPHLWARASELGLDLEQFERDRRSEQVRARVWRDFESGVNGGVTTTPTLYAEGRMFSGKVDRRTLDALAQRSRG